MTTKNGILLATLAVMSSYSFAYSSDHYSTSLIIDGGRDILRIGVDHDIAPNVSVLAYRKRASQEFRGIESYYTSNTVGIKLTKPIKSAYNMDLSIQGLLSKGDGSLPVYNSYNGDIVKGSQDVSGRQIILGVQAETNVKNLDVLAQMNFYNFSHDVNYTMYGVSDSLTFDSKGRYPSLGFEYVMNSGLSTTGIASFTESGTEYSVGISLEI